MTVHANPIALYSSLLYYVVMSTSRATFDLASTIGEAEKFLQAGIHLCKQRGQWPCISPPDNNVVLTLLSHARSNQ